MAKMENNAEEKQLEFHLDMTKEHLRGPIPELITVNNCWAAVGLNKYHKDSQAEIDLLIEGTNTKAVLKWNSDFSSAAMQEDKDIAHHGGVALAWFVMSVIMDYKYLEQTHIGDGVDYLFMKEEPNEDSLNFISDPHYVEISGILEEFKSNTLKRRVNDKHEQIKKGGKNAESSSVIVTLFSKPITIKEVHK